MSTTTDAAAPAQATAGTRTTVTAAGLAGAVAFAGYMGPFLLSEPSTQEYTRSPLVITSGVVATLAFVALAVTLPGLARAVRLPSWALYVTAAGCAFVAAMAWAWATMGTHVVDLLTEAQLEETSVWFEMIWVPKVVLCGVGLIALAVTGWRRHAVSRGAAVLLGLAGLASLLPAHPPGAVLAGIALAWCARSAVR
jgi:glucan phosphoethanolaminetransferase (alkaline phosphatase superfamily)